MRRLPACRESHGCICTSLDEVLHAPTEAREGEEAQDKLDLQNLVV